MHPLISRLRFGSVVCALALSGCLQVDQELTLHPDGSGHLSARYTLDRAQLEALAADVARASQVQPGVPASPAPAALFQLDPGEVRKEFKSFADSGLTLQDIQVTETNGSRTVHVEVDFKDVAGLSRSEFFADSSLSLARTPAGHFILRQDPPLHLNLSGNLREQQAALEAALNRQLRGFKADLRVSVPGDIVSTTATRHSGRTATWQFDQSRDPSALTRARRTALSVEFLGDGLAGLQPATPPPPEAARKGAGRDGA